MSDRELLEWAARAAGLNFSWGKEWHNKGVPEVDGYGWNPLTDDGDALRLAVKLCIKIEPTHNYGVTYAGSVCAKSFFEKANGDRCAATRRAITRAAAEIGKQCDKEGREG